MKGIGAIIENELRSRWPVFTAVMILGWLAPLSPWLAPEAKIPSAELSNTTALVLSLLVTLGGALGLGTQMIVNRQVEGRLSFFLARPISGWALWWGQIVAAMVTLAVCCCLIWLPNVLVEGLPALFVDQDVVFGGALNLPHSVSWELPSPFTVVSPWSPALPAVLDSGAGWIVLSWGMGCLLLLLTGHWISMMLRLKTRWVVFDLLLLCVAFTLITITLGGFHQLMAFREAIVTVLSLIMMAVTAALFAGGLQVARGGLSPTRGHGLFSCLFWSLTLSSLMLAYGYSQWLTSRGPRDLKTLENLHSSPDGEWLTVSGRVWGWGSYEGVFVYRPKTDEFHALGPRFALPGAPIFSHQSNAMAWIDCPLEAEMCALKWRELQGQQRQLSILVRREYIALYTSYRNRALALSEDGRTIAMSYEGRLEIYDAPSGDLLSVQRLDSNNGAGLHFDAAGRLRVHQHNVSDYKVQLDIWRMDLAADQWTKMASVPGVFRAVNFSADRMLVKTLEGGLALFDVWGQENLAHLDRVAVEDPASVRVLSTGEVISFEQDVSGQGRLDIYGPDGLVLHQIPLLAGDQALLGGEIERGKILVGLRPGRPKGALPSSPDAWLPGLGFLTDWRTRTLDVTTGWQEEVWPQRAPAWQFGRTFEQGRWLLSSGGIESLKLSSDEGTSRQRVLAAEGH